MSQVWALSSVSSVSQTLSLFLPWSRESTKADQRTGKFLSLRQFRSNSSKHFSPDFCQPCQDQNRVPANKGQQEWDWKTLHRASFARGTAELSARNQQTTLWPLTMNHRKTRNGLLMMRAIGRRNRFEKSFQKYGLPIYFRAFGNSRGPICWATQARLRCSLLGIVT